LPREIQLHIFLDSVSTERQHLDPSACRSASSPWLRMFHGKKSLPLICRATRWAGTAALYEDIVLRRMSQFAPLSRTLKSEDVGRVLGRMVRSIRMDTCMVLDEYAGPARRDLATIFKRCPNVKSVQYIPHPNFLHLDFPEEGWLWEIIYNPTWLFRPSSPDHPALLCLTASHLLHLDICAALQDADTIRDIQVLLQSTQRLQSLALKRSNEGASTPELTHWLRHVTTQPDLSPVHLPSLVSFTFDSGAHPELQRDVVIRWSLPALQRLTVVLHPHRPYDPMGLLERHGRLLRYLHLFPKFSVTESLTQMQEARLAESLDTLFPVLEHLVLPRFPSYPGPYLFRSPSLKWLDLWIMADHQRNNNIETDALWTPNADAIRASFVDRKLSATPSLRNVRLLDPISYKQAYTSEVRSTDAAQWPEICAPDAFDPGGPGAGSAASGTEGPGEERVRCVIHRLSTRWLLQSEHMVIPDDSREVGHVGVDLFGLEDMLEEISETGFVLKGTESEEYERWKLGVYYMVGVSDEEEDERHGDEEQNERHGDEELDGRGTA
ncbi:uncharacterized protein BXZ73DRAFT_55867, partial [Epithele typhae]|uniref:uncharacterized protein n=1 Tax=Epithele typhae TaxID=378194 RepID=UPI0020081861